VATTFTEQQIQAGMISERLGYLAEQLSQLADEFDRFGDDLKLFPSCPTDDIGEAYVQEINRRLDAMTEKVPADA
jgi:hypothetical protein